MIYITGDLHGNQQRWLFSLEPQLSEGDMIIITGDFGVGFLDDIYFSEETFYDYIATKKYTVLFTDGNHENFTKLSAYPLVPWNGGKVHKIRKNILHLVRGEVYQIEGATFFSFGGGFSIDKTHRRENVSWWKEEMPSAEEYENAKRNLQRVNYCVDCILTHTASTSAVAYLAATEEKVRGDVTGELPLTDFLEEIKNTVKYKKWYFGHLHVDKSLSDAQTAVYQTVHKWEKE